MNKNNYLELTKKLSEVYDIKKIVNMDSLSYEIQKKFDYHGVSIGLHNTNINILKIIGVSTVLPNSMDYLVKCVKLDFNVNKSAKNFFYELNKPKKISIKDLIVIITDNYNKSISSKILLDITDLLTTSLIGEIIIAPLINDDDSKIGALLLSQKSGTCFEEEDIKHIPIITRSLANLIIGDIDFYFNL